MSNLSKRILSAAFLTPLVIYLVFSAPLPVLHLSLSVVSFIATYEFMSIALKDEFLFQRVAAALLSSVLTYLVPLGLSHPLLLIGFLPISVITLFSITMFSRSELSSSLRALTSSLSSLFYVGLLSGFVYLIPHVNPVDGRYFLFLLLLSTFLGDTGAYAFGRLFGKKKLCPKLSPGKTWSGAFGGLFMSFVSILSLKMLLLSSLSFSEVFLLSLGLSLSCQVGDLAESFVKRGFCVKDSGNIIPGHGGLLDRIDALLFGAPVVFLFSFLR